MNIVKPSATLLSITPDAERLIERCGRVCYKSENKITEDSSTKFIQMIMKNGHESVLEHAVATIHFVCDRGVSHELVRHRLASYSQESTRYCNYKNGVVFIRPPFLDRHPKWLAFCRNAEKTYLDMLATGCTPQLARSVLPNCLKTEIIVTTNFREWRHIFKLRTSLRAHPQIREIMFIAQSILNKECPSVFPIGDYK